MELPHNSPAGGRWPPHRVCLGDFSTASQHSIAHCSTEPWNYRKAAARASFRNAQECEAFCAGEADGIITQFRIWPVVADLITGVSVQQHKSQIKCVFPLLHDMNRNQSAGERDSGRLSLAVSV